MLKHRRSRIKKKKSILKSRFFLFGFLFFVLAGSLGYFLLFAPMFQVQRMFVQGSSKGEEMASRLQKFIPSSLLFFETKSIFLSQRNNMEQFVLEQFPEVGNVRVFRDFPATLTLRVIERKEVAQWCSQDSCFALDKNGIIFSPADLGAFIRISSSSDPQNTALGEEVIESSLLSVLLDFQKRLQELDLLKKTQVRVLAGHVISKERINFSVSEGWKIFFNPQDSLDWQLTKLRLVLEKKIPPEKREALEYVDVRFGNQAYLKYR